MLKCFRAQRLDDVLARKSQDARDDAEVPLIVVSEFPLDE